MSLMIKARETIERAGISNYHLEGDELVLCGVRYQYADCVCGDVDCDGVRLVPKAPPLLSARQASVAMPAALPL